MLLQELFSKQKGYLEEELDYRKQTLDQAYMVWSQRHYDLSLYREDGQSHCNRQKCLHINNNIHQGLCTRHNGS